MANWLTYFKERFPFPVYVVLVGGIALSGNVLARGSFEWRGFLIAFVGLMGFFALLRLMDELKDYEKDLIVHPQRPLPRGVLKVETVAKVIRVAAVGMVVYSGLVAAFSNLEAGICYFVVTVWLWLMFKEFYLGQWLVDRPLAYAISHQLILLPLCAFAVLTHDGERAYMASTWIYGSCVMGAFFSYEVCRKLDPRAHPLLKTYLYIYGGPKTWLLVFVLNVVAAVSAYALDLGWWLWLPEIATVMTVGWVVKWPLQYKWGETVATLSLVLHIWAMSFAFFLSFWI
jgi:hypothetical protein